MLLVSVAALALGGAAAGAVILLGDESDSGDTTIVKTVTEAEEDQPTASEPEEATDENTRESDTPNQAPSESDASNRAPSDSDDGRAGATPVAEASEILTERWKAIDSGAYARAYAFSHSSYSTEESDWVEQQRASQPDVNLAAIRITKGDTPPADPAELWLEAEVPITDGAGDYAGDCRVWFGEVRMYRESGTWKLRPGPFAGREPTFGRPGSADGGIEDVPESDPRCP